MNALCALCLTISLGSSESAVRFNDGIGFIEANPSRVSYGLSVKHFGIIGEAGLANSFETPFAVFVAARYEMGNGAFIQYRQDNTDPDFSVGLSVSFGR